MLLDRFRTAPRHKDPDPLVRLAYIVEIPMDDRGTIASIAQEDEDPRVRRAAVAKLLDPGVLGRVAVSDGDDAVRNAAAGMLRDIALDAFEEAGETEALDAVDAMQDAKLLAQVAKSAGREIVALRAVSRLTEARALGSVARHAVVESVRRAAFDQVLERGDHAELLAVALNSEYKDTAVAAVESVADERELENIAARSRNKAASKRARAMLKDITDQRAFVAAEVAAEARRAALPVPATIPAPVDIPAHLGVAVVEESLMPEAIAEPVVDTLNDEAALTAAELDAPVAALETVPQVAPQEAPREAPREAIDEASHQRMIELAEQAERASGDTDLRQARKQLRIVRGEWRDLTARVTASEELAARLDEADRRVAAREAESREADERARRDAFARVQQLLKRVESLVVDPAQPGAARPGLHALERALRDVRHLASAMPMLPTKADADEALGRLKAAQAALTPRLQELREAEEWQQWANVTIQEQLCAKMEALQAVDDAERIAAEVKSLQQQWRQAANVPAAKADALWRRFKAGHDAVWPRCEAHFHAQAQLRGEHLARKIALCEQAETLAGSSNWIQAADEIKKLQAEWKSVGPVARAQEKAVWERFHAACNRFFTRRHDDLVQRKAVWAQNLAKKTALCEQAEQLATSTEWDSAATELKRLQAEWRTVGPVRKNKADTIWQRFRAASDTFFERYAHRHDTARVERIQARETLCNELTVLAAGEETAEAPADLQQVVQQIRQRWQEEASRPLDTSATSRALEERFATAMSQVIQRWPAAFTGGDLDVAANTQRLESLVAGVESLARSLAGPAMPAAPAADLSPTVRLAAMLKEALAANTIGGKVDPRAEEESRLRAAAEDVRRAQSNWSRIGFVPADVRRPLADRFDRASRAVLERAGAASRPAAAPRPAAPRRDAPREQRRGR